MCMHTHLGFRICVRYLYTARYKYTDLSLNVYLQYRQSNCATLGLQRFSFNMGKSFCPNARLTVTMDAPGPSLQISRWEVAAEWTQQKYSRRTLILSQRLCPCLPEEPTAVLSTEITV